MLQQLESRRLLSADVSYDPIAATLEIRGSAEADNIAVFLVGDSTDGDRREGPRPPGTFISVMDQRNEVYSNWFAGGTVREVNVFTGEGNDYIALNTNDSPIATNIVGEGGNDELEAFNAMSSPGSHVFGGAGDDIIRLANGKETLSCGHFAYGELGNDVIYGSRMSDTLFGDWDPNDPREWALAGGDDIIYAGAGNDVLYGGDGNDALYGEDGDDYLNGGLGEDLLDGGAGYDRGVAEKFEKFLEIEELMTVLS